MIFAHADPIVLLGVTAVILYAVSASAVVWALYRWERRMTTAFDRLKADMDALRDIAGTVANRVQVLVDTIAGLKGQIANGSAITQEQVDALDAEAQSTLSALNRVASSAESFGSLVADAGKAEAPADSGGDPATEPAPAATGDSPVSDTPATPPTT